MNARSCSASIVSSDTGGYVAYRHPVGQGEQFTLGAAGRISDGEEGGDERRRIPGTTEENIGACFSTDERYIGYPGPVLVPPK